MMQPRPNYIARREEMVWTSEKPTKPGWYWYKHQVVTNGSTPRCVIEVFFKKRGISTIMWAANIGDITHFTGEWAGPLDPPPEE